MSIWKTLGKIARVAAPIVGGIALGPLGGALAGGAVNAITKGGSVGDKLKAGAGGALAGATAGGAFGKIGGNTGLVANALGKIKKDPLKAVQLGTAGLSALSGAKKQKQADQITQQVLAQQQAQQAQRDQIRQQLLGRIGAPVPQAPNLGGLYGSSNPFARVG